MTEPAKTGQRPKRRLIAAGIAGSLAVIGAVYVIAGPNGNSNGGQNCKVSMKIADEIHSYATGEVAAFLPAQKPLSLTDLKFNGEGEAPVSVPDFKGKTVLMNFWATWCAPCRKEMPALDQLKADLSGPDFDVVAVSMDRGPAEKPKAFLKEIGAENLGFYHEPTNTLMTALRTKARGTGLPTTMLVGPDGCEIGTMYGPAEWASGEAKALIEAAIRAVNGTKS